MRALTVWRVHIRNIGVMRLATRPQANARGAAQGCRDKVIAEKGALVAQVLLNERRVGDRVQLEVLVVGDHEENVWRLGQI